MASPLFSVEGIGSSNLRRELARAAPTPGFIIGVAIGLTIELAIAYVLLKFLTHRGRRAGEEKASAM